MKRELNQVGRPALLRHTNARTILHLLREAGTCSRADLVRASGLSAPTVTKVVADLLEANLIRPTGEGASSGGRPPSMLAFKADRGCILAVEITASSLRFLLTDLSGHRVGEAETAQSEIVHGSAATTPEAICQRIGEEARRLLTQHKKARKQLLALVVAVPAIANVRDGTVVSISTLEKWRAVPLRSLLNRVVDCLVIVENNTNLAALGELFKGAALGETDFVLIRIAANLSAGIVLNGNIHHGSQWSAGEIGYLRLPSIAGKPPSLYEFGDLEQILSPTGIVSSWQSEEHLSGRSDAAKAAKILEMAAEGDAQAGAILEHRAQIVADILVNVSLILNPALVLFAGEIGTHPALLSAIQSYLDRCEFAVARIAAAALGADAALWGGIATGLEAIPSVLLPHPES